MVRRLALVTAARCSELNSLTATDIEFTDGAQFRETLVTIILTLCADQHSPSTITLGGIKRVVHRDDIFTFLKSVVRC